MSKKMAVALRQILDIGTGNGTQHWVGNNCDCQRCRMVQVAWDALKEMKSLGDFKWRKK